MLKQVINVVSTVFKQLWIFQLLQITSLHYAVKITRDRPSHLFILVFFNKQILACPEVIIYYVSVILGVLKSTVLLYLSIFSLTFYYAHDFVDRVISQKQYSRSCKIYFRPVLQVKHKQYENSMLKFTLCTSGTCVADNWKISQFSIIATFPTDRFYIAPLS